MRKITQISIAILFPLLTTHYSLLTTISAHSETRVVKIIPDGFEPAELTVDKNSTVIFLNKDGVPRWPASNIHPTHDLYPEFDPKKEIKPGESWSFKPKKEGSWKYHDHLKPHIRGKLIVAKETNSNITTTQKFPENLLNLLKTKAETIIKKLKNLLNLRTQSASQPENFKTATPQKQIEMLKQIAQKDKPEEVWNFLTQTYEGEAGSAGNIHDLAHLSGKLIFEKKGLEGIRICTTQFAFGCFHGLLDAAFEKDLTRLKKAEEECTHLGPANSGPYGSCVHGIGHGVASFYQTKDLKQALTTCDILPQGQNFCYDGVLMEFARGAPTSFYNADNPYFPCNQLEEEFGTKYSTACGRNQPSVLMSKFKIGFDEVTRACLAPLSNDFRNACFDALGFSLANLKTSEEIIKNCNKIKDPRFIARCLTSAAGELIFQDVPGWQENSPAICDASPANYRQSCHLRLQQLIKEYNKETDQKLKNLKSGQDENWYVREQLQVCYDQGRSDDCYQKVANLFSQQFGLKKTLSLISQNEEYPQVYARCHEVTHYLSRDEFKKAREIPLVYAQCDSTCHGGCYHGALEQYLKEKELEAADITLEFTKICGQIENFSTPLVFYECLHGLGHAAMFVTDMEVPSSLALCDTLKKQEELERCYSGVFMENSSSSTNNDHPGKYVKTDDPLYPCNWLGRKYAKICYRYQSSYFALIANHDWGKVAKLCLTVPENYQDDCFRTIGTNQVGFTQDANQMRKNCNLMPSQHFKDVCTAGIVSSFAYRFVGDDGRIAEFCTSVDGPSQEACFRQMGTAIVDWSRNPTDLTGACNRIKNAQHASWCNGS